MIYRYGLGRETRKGLPPRKRLEMYQKSYFRMVLKESRQHGHLTTNEIVFTDWLREKIDKLEAELGVEHPEPLVIPKPSKAEIDAIKAKLRQSGYEV